MPTATATDEAEHLRALLATDRRELRALLVRALVNGRNRPRDRHMADLRGRIARNDQRLQVLQVRAGELVR